MNAKKIQSALTRSLRISSGSPIAIMPNVFISGSPWECDLVSVRSTGYFVEYEIKTSRPDYLRDFEKDGGRYSYSCPKKHEYYASDSIFSIRGKPVPRPKSFYFVTPVGIATDLPDHAGLIEFDQTGKFHVIKVAPQLSKPTKLSFHQLWNISLKISSRFIL